MAVYFEGRKKIGSFSQSFESGRSRIDVQIFERWEDIDASTTARCGAGGSCQVAKSEGLSETSTHNLKGVIESALGVQGILNLKAQAEEVVGHEVNWNRAVTVTKTFPYTAPKCGRYTLTIYELVREYELTYWRRRRRLLQPDILDKKWTRTLRESTNTHDGLPDIEEYDERCNCPEAPPSEYDGRLCFDFGLMSFRVPYHLTRQGFDVQLFERVVSFAFHEDYASGIRSLEAGVNIVLPVAAIPEALKFLGDLGAEERVEPRVFKYTEPDHEPSMLLEEASAGKIGLLEPQPLNK